ncbi:DBP2 helicase, partial [Corythaeola cristata]|nr:DBP2 helicase [Corythaeola cristata]
EVIVTTPYSLLRLFEHHRLLFCRLGHLVLDEVEVLFSDATEQVNGLYVQMVKYYSSCTCVLETIIAVGTRWNKHVARLIKEFMNNPYIVITAMEEASIYGNVQQVVHLCTNSERTAVLLKILDFTRNNLQKVLVFTHSVNEAEMVHEVRQYLNLNRKVLFFLIAKVRQTKLSWLLSIKEELLQFLMCVYKTCLVLTDDCMQSLGITDATCVIHFSFPSARIFGQRLHSMSDNFCNVVKDSSVDQEYSKARSVILLTENSSCDALGILSYLQHAEAEIPPELHDFTTKMLEAEEDKKLSRPLCTYLKTFGICKNRTMCPDRHQIILQIDIPQNIPDKITGTPGYLLLVGMNSNSLTTYMYLVLVPETGTNFMALLLKTCSYLWCTQDSSCGLFFSSSNSPSAYCRAWVFVLQVSYHLEYSLSFLFETSIMFPQVAFFRIFIKWKLPFWSSDYPVTQYIHHKIRGKLHEAKIVHALGNTAWIDPMVRVTRLADLKISIKEYNVRSEILSTGLGTDNPEHIAQLQKLCGHAKVLDHAKNLEPLLSQNHGVCIQSLHSVIFYYDQWLFSMLTSQYIVPFRTVEHIIGVLYNFYPEIKWFQNEDTVTVKVKVASAANCKCEFSKEKVVFSACSGDKLYLADMELHQYILAEKSTCVIKDKEAIIVLAKEKKGAWCKLLKNKNPHVSFDFEHWKDFEDKSPFPVGTKKLYCTAALPEELADSSEDSGTESDE